MKSFLDQSMEEINKTVQLDRLRFIKNEMSSKLSPKADFPLERLLEANRFLNDMHREIVRQSIRCAEIKLLEQNLTLPCPYTFVLFGSGGRGEMSILSDQDNGIIYEDVPESEAESAESYFKELGIQTERLLTLIGYPACEGKVTCRYPTWNKPLSVWRNQLNDWSEESTWESIRYLLIVQDMSAVFGKDELASALKTHMNHIIKENKKVMFAMKQNTEHHAPAQGIFGNLRKVQYGEFAGGVEIKYNLYIPLVKSIRLLSTLHQIKEVSTSARLIKLNEAGVLNKSDCQRILTDFANALYLRTITSPKTTENGIESSGIIEEKHLSKSMVNKIKRGLQSVKFLDRTVREQLQMIDERGVVK